MKTLTVFTPTYNRANTIVRTYESLLRQTSQDFEWLVIDDGSTDDTGELIKKWISDARIIIRYIYKVNGGLHTGYNVAIKNIETELCICCDSDDYMPDNAVEIIINKWHREGNECLAGIIGLDYNACTHNPIGGLFNRTDIPMHFLDLSSIAKHHGDMKMVVRTSLLKPLVPMPTFKNEKNFNPIYLYLKVDPSLNYLVINENLCFVDYQSTGMSANIMHQFRNSPRSFAELRKVKLSHPRVSFIRKYIDAAHLVSSALIAHDISLLRGTAHKMLVALSVPLGIALYYYILYKTKK